jgi:NADH-quinone oxidoreductase subunit L
MSPDSLISLVLAILFIPLLSFVILISFGKKLPRKGDAIATGLLFLDLALAIVVLIGTLGQNASPIPGFTSAPIQSIFTWVDFNQDIMVFGNMIPLKIELGIMIDHITAIMLVVVTLISAVVHLFSISYMHGDEKYHRYFAYLGLFTFSMLGIVLTNNILMMYIFWELVGVSSYLLIGFWYEKPGPAYASKKAFLINRIGDVGMWIGIMILFTTFGTFRFDTIFEHIANGQLPMNSEGWLTAAGILLFCGAIGKSAQFPLHTWLPDAMEGPTPVSALIHAATMVAAGVFMVVRIFPMLSGDALTVIAVIGTITAFVAASIALVQNDIKKVLAYSTVSQLGYMILALGVGAYTAGFFHLVTHAMFKACLFLGSGSVIHAMHHAMHKVHDHDSDAQDVKNMGGLKGKMPITYLTFIVATLAISGVPLFSGFLSKDEILAGTWAYGSLRGGLAIMIPYIGFGVAAMTAFYMFRLVILMFHGESKRPDLGEHVHESPWPIKVPLIVLSALSIWFVFSFNPFGGANGWFMQTVQAPVTVTGEHWYDFDSHGGHEAAMHEEGTHEAAATHAGQEVFAHSVHEAHTSAMITSLIVASLGILIAFLIYSRKIIDIDAFTAKVKPLHTFLMKKWYFDEIYEQWLFVPLVMLFSKAMAWFDAHIVDGAVNGLAWFTVIKSKGVGLFDKYVIDGGVNATGFGVGFVGLVFRKTQSGRIQTYLAIVLVGIVVLLYAFR